MSGHSHVESDYIDIECQEGGTPSIVVLDGDPHLANLLLNPRLVSALSAVGGIRVYTTGAPKTQEEFLRRVDSTPVVMFGWPVPGTFVDSSASIEMMCYLGTGADNFVDLRGATAKGILVTNTPGYGNSAVAEHAVGLTLAGLRRTAFLDRELRIGSWTASEGSEIEGKVVGLVGVGGIGAHAAKLYSAFGATVIAWTRNPSPERAKSLDLTFVDLDEIAKKSDVISLHLTLNNDTREIISKEFLQKMKDGALLVNTARAELIDEVELHRQLKEGRLSAALDVFGTEPLASGSPYIEMDNVTLTPHVGFSTQGAVIRMLQIALENVVSFRAGSAKNVVN